MQESWVSLILASRGQKPITDVKRSRPFLVGHVHIKRPLHTHHETFGPRDKLSFCLSFDANFSSFVIGREPMAEDIH